MPKRYAIRLAPLNWTVLSVEYFLVVLSAVSEDEAVKRAFDCLMEPKLFKLDKVEAIGGR